MLKKLQISRGKPGSEFCLETITITLNDYIIDLSIYYDEDTINPRKFDSNLAEFICFSKRFKLGDEHDYATPDDFMEWLESEEAKYYLVEPLYAYIHSGISISTSPFYDPWDSGQVGWVRVDLRKICEEFYPNVGFDLQNDDFRSEILKTAEGIIHSEVNVYDMYIRGDVYGFSIEVRQRLNGTDYRELDDLYDSLSGCYGMDDLRMDIQNSMLNILESLGLSNSEAVNVYEEICDNSDYLAPVKNRSGG